jgi:hypothetical protein
MTEVASLCHLAEVRILPPSNSSGEKAASIWQSWENRLLHIPKETRLPPSYDWGGTAASVIWQKWECCLRNMVVVRKAGSSCQRWEGSPRHTTNLKKQTSPYATDEKADSIICHRWEGSLHDISQARRQPPSYGRGEKAGFCKWIYQNLDFKLFYLLLQFFFKWQCAKKHRLSSLSLATSEADAVK